LHIEARRVYVRILWGSKKEKRERERERERVGEGERGREGGKPAALPL